MITDRRGPELIKRKAVNYKRITTEANAKHIRYYRYFLPSNTDILESFQCQAQNPNYLKILIQLSRI